MIFAAIADWVDKGEYDVDFMCTELAVSRSGYYAWRNRPPSDRDVRGEEWLIKINSSFKALDGNPGVRRIHAELAAGGDCVGGKRVHRLMQAAGLQGRHPKSFKRTTVAGENPVGAPDLIGRDFTAAEPNTRWVGDITYSAQSVVMCSSVGDARVAR